MNATGPWWITPVLTLGGVLLTLLVTVWLDARRGRRESRHRWTEHKMAIYSEFLDACDDFRDLPVWPATDLTESVTRIRRVARRAVYFAPGKVRETIAGVVGAARELAATVDEIRATTKAGHNNGLDDRVRPRFEQARAAFDGWVDAFAGTSRADIDISGPFDTLAGA